jgi:hypothetical protein
MYLLLPGRPLGGLERRLAPHGMAIFSGFSFIHYFIIPSITFLLHTYFFINLLALIEPTHSLLVVQLKSSL